MIESSSLVSLIERISMERSARRILSSSICFVRLLMFKPAILKPRPEGRKSERIVLSNESTF